MNRIKVGDVFTTNQGCGCEVVEYVNSRKVKIKFLDEHGYEMFVQAVRLRSGGVKNPYHPSVCGVGYLGVGEYKASFESKVTKEYSTWGDMLARSYVSKCQEKNPTYKGCYVDEAWHNFQEFARWFNIQYKEDGWQLDKDLLKRGNKKYSSDYCRMVPREVNILLTDFRASRGEHPLGVKANWKGFQAQINVFGKSKKLGTYTTSTEAFLVYKKAKELHIKEVANLYKETLCPDIYKALISWEVECPIYDKLTLDSVPPLQAL